MTTDDLIGLVSDFEGAVLDASAPMASHAAMRRREAAWDQLVAALREAQAEIARLTEALELVEEFLEQHPSGEHWQAEAEGGPAGWCGECLAEWPCLFERARAALSREEPR